MRRSYWLLAALAVPALALAQARSLGSMHGPDSVFDRDVAEVLPELRGARPSGPDGRVGGELVFWGYALEDGREAFLFACALVPNVDCEARSRNICTTPATVLASGTYDGTVSRRRCRAFAFGAPGEVRPGCETRAETVPLAVGLVQCG